MSVLLRFYVRRFLRIFPLYYFVLGLAIAANYREARELAQWLLTYTSNIYMTTHGEWLGGFSHFWTLAVEEQFYLVWPLLLLFLPKKHLIPALVLVMGAGPLYRAYAVTHHVHELGARYFTVACFDVLGMGALLAVMPRTALSKTRVGKLGVRLMLPVGIVATILLCNLRAHQPMSSAYVVFIDLALALVCCRFVSAASRGLTGIAGAVLASRPLRYIGKISYGLYVYHYFMPTLFSPWIRQLGLGRTGTVLLQGVVCLLASLVVAALSWSLLESPLNSFKRYFAYEGEGAEQRDSYRRLQTVRNRLSDVVGAKDDTETSPLPSSARETTSTGKQ